MKNLAAAGQTSFGDQGDGAFRANGLIDSERFRELDRRQSYFDCTQHDYKRHDFDGRIITASGGIGATQPLMSAEKVPYYVPLRARRPSAPYRLPRVIVKSFTKLVFGENRFPTFRVEGDPDTEDYTGAIVKATRLPLKMIQARDLGGAMGSVGLSWCYVDGRPHVRVHNSKNIFFHEWEDRDELIPRHVTEIYQYKGTEEWDSTKRRFVRNLYWARRDWTPNVDVVFKNVRVEPGKEPNFEPDFERSVEHNDNLVHFSWIQNTPSEEVDGLPDYEGLYENFDTLDLMLSVIVRGAILNLDPTLVLKMDPEILNRVGVRKGSDQALVVGPEGDAEYLELAGTSITAGIALFNTKRKSILEVAQCVIPDPDQLTAAGTSSVAMKLLYNPATGVSDILREQYAAPMERMLDAMLTVARAASKSSEIITDESGQQREIQKQIILPPKVENEPKLDEDGVPTGENEIKLSDRDPGEGGDIETVWGPYFPPTPADQSQAATTFSLATGTQPFMSTQTASELFSGMFGREATDETARMAKETAANQAKQSQMFGDADGTNGGKVEHNMQLPDGSTIKQSKGGPKPLPPGANPFDPNAEPGDSQDPDAATDDDPAKKKNPFPPKE